MKQRNGKVREIEGKGNDEPIVVEGKDLIDYCREIFTVKYLGCLPAGKDVDGCMVTR